MRSSVAGVMAATILALGAPATAAPIVDQSTLLLEFPEGTFARASPIGGSQSQPTANIVQFQEVTAGLSGRLTRVDLQLLRGQSSTPLPITLSVYDGSRLSDDARLVGAVTIPGEQIPRTRDFYNQPFVTVDLSSFMFDLDAGDLFSLELSALVPNTSGFTANILYGWESGELDANDQPVSSFYIRYEGGANYLSQFGGPFQQTLYDRGFRTFIDPISVPEPAGVALLGLGVLVMASRRRRAGRGSTPA